jgi:hypothetical protein
MQDEECCMTKYKVSKSFLEAWPHVAREFSFSVLTLSDPDESMLVLLWSKEMWTRRNQVIEPCVCWTMYAALKRQEESTMLK